MKAMVLAAGFGTRLRPYTARTPKPLFTIAGTTLLDRIIRQLVNAGASTIVVNTHHLHAGIAAHLAARDYGIPVNISHEAQILGTGGALKKAARFWDENPFMVVNSDIYTDVDLQAVYRCHLKHGAPVTMVLCDDPDFNQVTVRQDGTVADFSKPPSGTAAWTFTGIHVVDPRVLDLIPAGRFVSIIDTYRRLIDRGERIHAFIPQGVQWDDVGSLERYTRVARRETWKKAFAGVYPDASTRNAQVSALAGDGSDRKWLRIACEGHRMIMVDHGPAGGLNSGEADAFVSIGRHLHLKGVPVPEIFFADTFAGLVCMEDLGDEHLQEWVRCAASEREVIGMYRKVVSALVRMSFSGLEGFDPSWAWQSPAYDRKLILDKECRYFVEAFLNRYLEMGVAYEAVAQDFERLAEETLENGLTGFMHRDFQSRNIMVCNDRPRFIDFQAGRPGPLQYDLASLLIDPYAALSPAVQEALLAFAVQERSGFGAVDAGRFLKGYACCCITRNLQALGAFGHLSKNRGKSRFARYIPTALTTLKKNLERHFPGNPFPRLKQSVDQAVQVLGKIPRP